jgi:aminocarboxymuconate-semialdehyde decarboxylase
MGGKIIDVFNHYLPPAFYDKITELGGKAHMLTRARNMPAMSDIRYRLKLMQRFEGYCQIPCIVSPNVEQVVAPEHTSVLARFANEEFRRLCDVYPEFFPSFVAVLPLDDMEKAANEAEYAVKELGAAGVQIFTNLRGNPIDTPDFYYLYEKIAGLDTALWIHPIRTVSEPFYKGEQYSKYELWWTLLWPVETGMAVARLVYSGLFQKYPDFKVIIHHGGGFIPMMEGRLENGLMLYSTRTAPDMQYLVESPVKGKCQIDDSGYPLG